MTNTLSQLPQKTLSNLLEYIALNYEPSIIESVLANIQLLTIEPMPVLLSKYEYITATCEALARDKGLSNQWITVIENNDNLMFYINYVDEFTGTHYYIN